MKFSTRTTYGLRAITRLAENYEAGFLSLRQIADSEELSKSYLERLFSRLKEADLVKASKGVSGGYKLSLRPDETSLLDVVRALEGELSPFHCVAENGKIKCSQKCRCTATRALLEVQQAVNMTLARLTLKDLLNSK